MVDVAPLMVLSQMLVGVLSGVVVVMDPEKERKVEDKCFRQPFSWIESIIFVLNGAPVPLLKIASFFSKNWAFCKLLQMKERYTMTECFTSDFCEITNSQKRCTWLS